MTARPLPKLHAVSADQMLKMVGQNMAAHFALLHKTGRSRARCPEEFYGFRPEDVVELHLYKQGFGRGVWFRLRDGRVIDAHGKPSHPERYWYVSSAH